MLRTYLYESCYSFDVRIAVICFANRNSKFCCFRVIICIIVCELNVINFCLDLFLTQNHM